VTAGQKPDSKSTVSAFNQLVRDQRASRRVHWIPSTSLDPAERRKDLNALNAAFRKAGGRQRLVRDPAPNMSDLLRALRDEEDPDAA
jgi:hypothetical protein